MSHPLINILAGTGKSWNREKNKNRDYEKEKEIESNNGLEGEHKLRI
jgi:hypothetical protein